MPQPIEHVHLSHWALNLLHKNWQKISVYGFRKFRVLAPFIFLKFLLHKIRIVYSTFRPWLAAQTYPSKLVPFLKYVWSSVKKASEAKASVFLKLYIEKISKEFSYVEAIFLWRKLISRLTFSILGFLPAVMWNGQEMKPLTLGLQHNFTSL